MTKGYEIRLIELAKELLEMDKIQTFSGSKEDAERLAEQSKIMYYSKINYLLGYILALEEIEHE